jgi:hypothetical protein
MRDPKSQHQQTSKQKLHEKVCRLFSPLFLPTLLSIWMIVLCVLGRHVEVRFNDADSLLEPNA